MRNQGLILALWMLFLISCGVQADASTYPLYEPRILPRYAAEAASASPWTFTPEGVWESSSGRYLRPLPFAVDHEDTLLWKAPWLLGLNTQNQLYQSTPEKVLRIIPYRHPEALERDCQPELVHSGPWVISMSELVRIKRIQHKQVQAQSEGLRFYWPAWRLATDQSAVTVVDTTSQKSVLRFDLETLDLERDLTDNDPDSQPYCLTGYQAISHWFQDVPWGLSAPINTPSDSPHFSAGRLGAALRMDTEQEVALGRDQVFRIHDLRNGERVAEFSLSGGEISAWDLDGEYLAIARSSPLQPMLEVWHWPSMQQKQVFNGPHTLIRTLQLQGDTLVSVTAHDFCGWDLSNPERPASCHVFKYPYPKVYAAEKEPLSLYFCSSNYSQQVKAGPVGQLQIEAPVEIIVEKNDYQIPRSYYASHLLQLGNQQILQHVPGESLRVWGFGERQPKILNPCQHAPSDWADCWSELIHWSGERVFMLLYDDFSVSFGVAANQVPPTNQPKLAIILNLQTGQTEQLVVI